jgi:hypothetical protein
MDPLRSARLPGDPFAGGLRDRLMIACVAILMICALAAFGLS